VQLALYSADVAVLWSRGLSRINEFRVLLNDAFTGVREYWNKPDVRPPLIRNSAGDVEVVPICARLARFGLFPRGP
jgi:hypothetical protein